MEYLVHSRTALVDRATQVLAVHGGVVMSRVHSGIPLLCLVGIPLLCVVVWVRVSLGECPTPPTLRAPYIPCAIVLCLKCTMVLYSVVEVERREQNHRRIKYKALFDSPLVRLAAVQSPRLESCIYLGVSALRSSRDYFLYGRDDRNQSGRCKVRK